MQMHTAESTAKQMGLALDSKETRILGVQRTNPKRVGRKGPTTPAHSFHVISTLAHGLFWGLAPLNRIYVLVGQRQRFTKINSPW